MTARFFRKASFFVTSKTLDSKRQGFLFQISLGFEGHPDPKTGMIVQLTEIDQALRSKLPQKTVAKNYFVFFDELKHLLLPAFRSWGLVQMELKDQWTSQSMLWKSGKDFLSIEEAVHLPDERSLASPALLRIYFQVEEKSLTPVGLQVTYLGETSQVYEEGECP